MLVWAGRDGSRIMFDAKLLKLVAWRPLSHAVGGKTPVSPRGKSEVDGGQ